MTTQKLSDEELERWSVISDRFVMHHVVEIRNSTFSKILTELRESRKKLARVEELVSALEKLSIGAMLVPEISYENLRDFIRERELIARLALENWRKNE